MGWTSYHWSLSQFTGSMEVFPTNVQERVLAVIILLFAFVVTAWVVSSITSSMTRLEIATARESEKLTMLTRYLFDHKISRRIALRVQRSVRSALQEQQRNVPEKEIELLSLVSEPLRVEIHFEIHDPIIGVHPFFNSYGDTLPGIMR